jgi:hypothetical protein
MRPAGEALPQRRTVLPQIGEDRAGVVQLVGAGIASLLMPYCRASGPMLSGRPA